MTQAPALPSSYTSTYRISPEEDRETSGCFENWDVCVGVTRWVRVSLKRFPNSTFCYIKLFKKDMDSSEWLKSVQVALSLDELVAITNLTDSSDMSDLTEKEMQDRSSFSVAISKLIDPDYDDIMPAAAKRTKYENTTDNGFRDNDMESSQPKGSAISPKCIDNHHHPVILWEKGGCVRENAASGDGSNKQTNNKKKLIPKKY